VGFFFDITDPVATPETLLVVLPLPLMPRPVKVAVIGSGLAGLTAAYLLVKPTQESDVEFELHLFEKVCAAF
jgi:microfibrillar-associated protein 1